MYRRNEMNKLNYMSSIDLKYRFDDNNQYRKSPPILDQPNTKIPSRDIQNKVNETRFKVNNSTKTQQINKFFSPKNEPRLKLYDNRLPQKYHQQFTNISSRQKQFEILIILETINNRHQVKYKFTESTLIREMIEYLKQIVGQKVVLFKSGNMMIDYLLTLNLKVILLINYNLTLKAQVRKNISFPQNSLKRFNIIKCIGSGGFSKVFFAEVNGIFVALKLINKNFLIQNEKEGIIQNQRKILLSLDHPFITKVHYMIQTQKFYAIAMEYCNGGQLFYLLKKVRKMKEDQARFYFLEVLAALKALHQKNIAYRDLKPENIIIDYEGHIRLADYGLSKFMDEELSYSFCGSAEYMAPQMLQKAGHSHLIDLYCIGALLFQLVTGLPPFFSKNQDQLFHNILNQKLVFPHNSELSPQIKSLLSGLLEKNPQKRLGCKKGINQILGHPWVQNISLNDIIQKKLIPPFRPNPLQYNFDDSEYHYQQATQLRQLVKEKENGDLKIPTFHKFYFESQEMREKRLELEGILEFNAYPKNFIKANKTITSITSPFVANQKLAYQQNKKYNNLSHKDVRERNVPKLIKYQPIIPNKTIIRKYESTPNLELKYSVQKKRQRYIPQYTSSLTYLKKSQPTISKDPEMIRSIDKNRRWNLSSGNINASYSKQKIQNYRKYDSKKYLSNNYNINNLEFMNPKYNQKNNLKKGVINKDKYRNLYNK